MTYNTYRFLIAAYAALYAIMMAGCASARLDKYNYNINYNKKIGALHPQLYAHNISSDSAVLYIKIPAGELLYAKHNEVMQAEFIIWYGIYSGMSSSQLIDSAAFHLADNYSGEPQELTIPITHKRVGNKYVVHVKFYDKIRAKHAEKNIVIESRTSQSAVNFALIENTSPGIPLFNNIVNGRHFYRLHTYSKAVGPLYIRHFNDVFPMAAPPFKHTDVDVFSYSGDSTTVYNNDVLHFHNTGIYHFQYDTLTKDGYTVFYFDEDYPKIVRPDMMLQPLRYLTTNEEYAALQKNEEIKNGLDNFWLKCGGNENRAAQLISNYYNNVQYANEYFTSYTQGWKTDRGMIYIVIGPPDVVYKTDDAETWEYRSGGYTDLRFTFKKISNPFSQNDFQLVRSISYEVIWYQAVEKWRAGRL